MQTEVVQSIDLVEVQTNTAGYNAAVDVKDVPKKQAYPANDIVKAIFDNKPYINALTKQQASQNIFLVLRRLGMKYPEHANMFNRKGVNPLDTIKFLSDFFYTGRAPSWIYTKKEEGTKTAKTKNELSNSDITEYLNFYGMSRKDFNDAMRLVPEDMIKDVKDYLSLKKKTSVENEKSDN